MKKPPRMDGDVQRALKPSRLVGLPTDQTITFNLKCSARSTHNHKNENTHFGAVSPQIISWAVHPATQRFYPPILVGRCLPFSFFFGARSLFLQVKKSNALSPRCGGTSQNTPRRLTSLITHQTAGSPERESPQYPQEKNHINNNQISAPNLRWIREETWDQSFLL